MIPIYRLMQSIPDYTGITVLIIVVSAFALSFFNLQAVDRQLNMSRHTGERYKPVETVQEVRPYSNEMFNLHSS